ncbi:MAG: hypothetical protein M1839_006946 [Geoglossum umbratile]|nr:MAG: hypothetical protein M1839_006946 [Geoglossum umbratile]
MVIASYSRRARREGFCPSPSVGFVDASEERRFLPNSIFASLSATSSPRSLTSPALLPSPSLSSFSSSSSVEIYQHRSMANPALVPGPFWHTRGLEFTSWQGVFQSGEEGTERISGRYRHQQSGTPSDELITLYMSSATEISGFVEQRSVLALSPTLADFFDSPSFTPGMATCIWLGREHPIVVKIALYYLLLHNPIATPASSSYLSSAASAASSSAANPDYSDGEFKTPNLARYSKGDQVYLQVRLYFLAKRLRLPRLEDVAYEMLREGEKKIGAREVVDLAEVIYDKDEEEDSRIRLFLNNAVETNLRALLNLPAWRSLLCTARPTLAANMFELISTILLHGSAPTYPIRLPRPNSTRSSANFSLAGKKVLAIAMRHFYSESPGDLCIVRGEVLSDCWVGAEWVVGTDRKGKRGYFPRDWVELIVDEDGEEEVEEGVGRKAGSLLGIVPPRDGGVGAGKKRSKLATLRGWGKGLMAGRGE